MVSQLQLSADSDVNITYWHKLQNILFTCTVETKEKQEVMMCINIEATNK